MDLIKRKILLEDNTDRDYNSPNWGTVTATTFYLNIMLTQDIDDMGLFTDIGFVELSNPFNGPTLTSNEEFIVRDPQKKVDDYYKFNNIQITGVTDSKIDDVKSYDLTRPYIQGFDIKTGTYTNYDNDTINGVDRVTSLGEPSIYVFDAENDVNIGTTSQVTGLKYDDYTGVTRSVNIGGELVDIPLTEVAYIGEGWNETNTSLSATTKEEYLFGIISVPEVESDVFIDRGITSVMDMHLRLSEVKDLGQLTRYGNGFYKINKQ